MWLSCVNDIGLNWVSQTNAIYAHWNTCLIQSLELIIAGVRATTFVFIIFSIIFFKKPPKKIFQFKRGADSILAQVTTFKWNRSFVLQRGPMIPLVLVGKCLEKSFLYPCVNQDCVFLAESSNSVSGLSCTRTKLRTINRGNSRTVEVFSTSVQKCFQSD